MSQLSAEMISTGSVRRIRYLSRRESSAGGFFAGHQKPGKKSRRASKGIDAIKQAAVL
jgi:hypothetical protein